MEFTRWVRQAAFRAPCTVVILRVPTLNPPRKALEGHGAPVLKIARSMGTRDGPKRKLGEGRLWIKARKKYLATVLRKISAPHKED